jgi:hypothetical protein
MSRALDFSSVAASCIHFAFLCARVHVTGTVVTTFQLNKFIEYKSFRLSSSNRFNFCYYIRNMTTITATKDKTDVDKLKLFQLKDASILVSLASYTRVLFACTNPAKGAAAVLPTSSSTSEFTAYDQSPPVLLKRATLLGRVRGIGSVANFKPSDW